MAIRPTAHTALVAASYLLNTAVGDGVMNKFGSSIQQRSELISIVTFHSSVERAAMNAPRLWRFRKDCLNGVAKGAKVFCKQQNAGFSLSIRKTRTLTPLSNCATNFFTPTLGIGILIANIAVRGVAESLKGSRRMGTDRFF